MGWLNKLFGGTEEKAFSIHYEEPEPDFYPAGLVGGPYRSRTLRGGGSANVVMSPVGWIGRNFTSAELVMQRKTKGLWRALDDHDVVALVDKPNPFYDGDLLWKATLISYLLDGNAYWLKVRNKFGGVVQLWYLPHFLIEPETRAGSSEFITHYEYRPYWGGPKEDIPLRDIVHLRYGLDPWDIRKGLSPVKPILSEVYTDEEAASFSASILGNMGVPGGVIAPKDHEALPSPEDVAVMKEYMRTAFSGKNRGQWLVLGSPTETSQFGFNPQNLMLGNLRDIAEERVCAALGIPAAVVGFGAGLQSTKVGATMKELRKLAWTSCIEPMQTTLAKQLTSALVPEFATQSRRLRLRFDTSMVPAFQEEETERATRIAMLTEKGLLRVDKAQEMLGLEPDSSQAVYLRPAGTTPVPAGEDPMDFVPATPTASADEGDQEGEEGVERRMARAQGIIKTLEAK